MGTAEKVHQRPLWKLEEEVAKPLAEEDVDVRWIAVRCPGTRSGLVLARDELGEVGG